MRCVFVSVFVRLEATQMNYYSHELMTTRHARLRIGSLIML